MQNNSEKFRKEKKRLVLKGQAFVFIDWANVYGWTKSLPREVDAEKLFFYLKTYPEIAGIRLYFGRDVHPKSAEFLRRALRLGYTVIEKPVKYIPVSEIEQQKIYRRKCDFDMEACIDVHQALKEGISSFIFFTGDGDYEPLYKMLIALRKQVIVVYAHGHLGREIYALQRGIYKKPVDTLGSIFD